MAELVPGGNQPLPDGTLTIRVPGPFDLSALITGDDGKVTGDGDFVFFNQPTAPGTRVDGDTVTVRPERLRPGASRVTVVVSPADPGTPLGRLPAPVMSVTGSGGAPLARFAPARPTAETVLLLAEIYRRGARWKVRAIGQGYADGLAGVARDFGVDVMDEPTPPPTTGDGGGDGTLGLVNAARSRHGVPPVTLDPRLTRAAEAHAAAMAAHGALAAESPDGTSLHHRIAASGYAPLTVAEHLVSGPRTPDAFIEYCLSGEEGRGPFRDPAVTHVGIGRASGTADVFWTAVWARPFTADGLRRLTSEVIALTNAERAAARLAPLAPDPRLTAAAQAHSDDMVVRDFYDHTSPEGRQPWDRATAAGATHRGIGENIACGQRGPAEVVQGWMNSPGHRANILKPDFTHIGVGYATGSRAGTYWTQVFGAAR
ncbi:CAP domain-containing protein [Streptomyces sp. NPDC021098]|uniref:CAP domain-containing protein n=1 Tax=unclassified Streptomyces TaxID=2593676 RepID=UPI0037AECBED